MCVLQNCTKYVLSYVCNLLIIVYVSVQSHYFYILWKSINSTFNKSIEM